MLTPLEIVIGAVMAARLMWFVWSISTKRDAPSNQGGPMIHPAKKPMEGGFSLGKFLPDLAPEDAEALGQMFDDMEAAKEAGRKAADDAASSLDLLSRVRFALGDNGTRMQADLIAYCAELRANRSDWERAHEILDAHWVLNTPRQEVGHHLIERIEAALKVWDAIGLHSGQCCADLKYLCNTGPEVIEAIRAYRAAFTGIRSAP